MSPAAFVSMILFPNRQVPKGVGTEMRGLVAPWGLLLHDEGSWSAVELKPRVSRVGGSGPPFGAPRRALGHRRFRTWVTRFKPQVMILRKENVSSIIEGVVPTYRKLPLA